MKTRTLLVCGIAATALLVILSPTWAQGGADNDPTPPAAAPDPAVAGPWPFRPTLEQLDPNQDGTVTRDEYTAAWNKSIADRFAWLDANHDGALSTEELASRPGPGFGPGPRGYGYGPPGFGMQGGPGNGPRRGMGPAGGPMAPMPPAGGQMPPMPPAGAPNPPMAFPGRLGGGLGPMQPSTEQLDPNQDGTVTRNEYTAAWNKAVADRFALLDANGDGQLGTDELATHSGLGFGPAPRGGIQGGGPGDPGGTGNQRP